MLGISVNATHGERARRCGAKAKNRNAGTGCTPAPALGWIIAAALRAADRPVIAQRGLVATRQGIEGLRTQLHAEALRRGLGQAAGALVIADGAVWIWRLADDRWPHARQRLDFYHA